jgi:hypothetical protein
MATIEIDPGLNAFPRKCLDGRFRAREDGRERGKAGGLQTAGQADPWTAVIYVHGDSPWLRPAFSREGSMYVG